MTVKNAAFSSMEFIGIFYEKQLVFAAFATMDPYVIIIDSICGGVTYTDLTYTVPYSVTMIEKIGINCGYNDDQNIHRAILDMVTNGTAKQNIMYGDATSVTVASMDYEPKAKLRVGKNTFSIVITVGGNMTSQTLTITRLPDDSTSADCNSDYEYEKRELLSKAPVYEKPDASSKKLGEIAAGETVSLLRWTFGETWCRVLYSDESNAGWIHRKHILGK